MSWGPIKLRHRGGEITFEGEASPAPGGGSMPVQGWYSGNAVAVNNNAQESLTWDSLDAGVELLDRTDPANPLFLAAGTYAITANAQSDAALTAGGFAFFGMSVPTAASYFNPTSGAAAVPEDGLPTLPAFAVVEDADLPVPLLATIFNADGVASRNFNLNPTLIVKLA